MFSSSLRAESSDYGNGAIELLIRLVRLAANRGTQHAAEQPPLAPVAMSPAPRSHWVDHVRLSAPR